MITTYKIIMNSHKIKENFFINVVILFLRLGRHANNARIIKIKKIIRVLIVHLRIN